MEPARQPLRWPLGWLCLLVVVMAGGCAGWCLVLLVYGTKLSPAYYSYIFPLGPGLLLVLALVGLLALVLAFLNAFHKQGRRALAWFLLFIFSGGSCALGAFPVTFALAANSGMAEDGHQNE